MLVFDQLKKNDPQLQLLTVLLCGGLATLFAGLWWVQVVNASRYRASVETQSFRTVRLSAVRGKILDRNGVSLAENRPNYNVSLYVEELSNAFKREFQASRPRKVITNDLPFWKDWLGISSVKTQYLRLQGEQASQVIRTARYRVAQNVVNQVAAVLQTPLPLDFDQFTRHYETARAMPFCIASNLSPLLVARFEEQPINAIAVDLEILSKRFYPYSNTAAHVLGYVRSDDSSAEGEEAYFSYRMPDYLGLVGIEGGFDPQLRGRAGTKSVQVNNLGYRQTENIWEAAEPGQNVVLTLDLAVQREVEAALRKHIGAEGQGAVVVMEVHSGDILALASSPNSDPNAFIRRFTPTELARWKDNALGVQRNRATAEQYQAGSIFKTIVALAALENGLDKSRLFQVAPNPRNPNKGVIYVGTGRRPYNDTAPPGDYDLRKAIARSSNSYFIQIGGLPNVFERVVELGRRLHFGERIGLPLLQEAAGHFPRVGGERDWNAIYRANTCIGQGYMDVTPMQVAVMISAIANGGTVLNPRLVDHLEPNDPLDLEPPTFFPRAQVRDRLGVSKRSLDILRDAMLSETESNEGTGRQVQGCGFRVCGKTGTAEIEALREDGQKRNTTWFASFAPYEDARYAVVVMVENGQGGGSTCAPIARDIYVALKTYETRTAPKTLATSPEMSSIALNETTPRVDRLQLAAIFGLMVIGVAFVFSATMVNDSIAGQPLVKQLWFRQIAWYGIGVGLAVMLCFVDYHTLARWAGIAFWVSVVLLVAVMFFGTVRGGAQRWFNLGFFSLQPSEFAKLAFVLAMASFLSRPADELRQPLIFWKAIGLMAIPFVLIMKEPDLGSALVFIPSGFAMMLVAGVPRRFLIRLIGIVGVLASLILVDVLFAPPSWQIRLEEYQRQRLLVYFGKDFARANATPEEQRRARQLQQERSYQGKQALISVGSGGFTGKGWRQGDQTAGGFLPPGAAHTDFIFSVIAEEEGFVGSVIVITLYAVLLFTGLRIAGQARDRLGKVLAAGVVTLLFSHVFINIGMNIRLMPVTGIPLPLLSYGGSSVLGSLIAMGLLQNVHIYRRGY